MKNRASGLEKYPFRICDIAVYALIAALIAVLFISSVPKSGLSAEVTVKGERVMTVDFSGKRCEIYSAAVKAAGENEYLIVSENGYNVLEIDYAARTVRVKGSDCAGKECVSMDLANGAIVCAPHSLVVRFTDDGEKVKVG